MNRILRGALLAPLVVALTALGAAAQFGLGPQPSKVYRGATVFDGERFIEDCDLVVTGKRVTAVGPKLVAPEGADEIDARGLTITPALIDASSRIGLASSADSRPSHDVLDAVDLFDDEPFADALAQGVGYVYLAPRGRPAIGGKGRLVRVPGAGDRDPAELAVEGAEALHVRLGSDPRGPIARFSQIKELRAALERAVSYRDQWEKYAKDLETYEKELAEWAKGKKSGAARPAPAAETAPAAEAAGAAPTPRQGRGRTPRPRRAPAGFGFETVFGLALDEHGEGACSDPSCAVDGPHDHEHDHDHEGDDHGDHDGTLPDPGLVRLTEDRPQLRPRLSHVDDGTEPHMRWPDRPSDIAGRAERISTCPHCGTSDPWAPAHLEHRRAFEDDAFAAEGERLLVAWYRDLGLLGEAIEAGLVDEPQQEGEAKKDEGEGAKEGGEQGGKDADGRPKRPREPNFDPDLEELVRALKGKLRVRVEVHRAEDIVNLIALLRDHPLDAVLEGATEGRRVAESIAEADLAVLTDCLPVAPVQEIETGRDASPFRRPSARNFRGGPTRVSSWPAEGEASSRNPAIMAEAGAEIALSAMKDGATPSLLAVASYAAGQGLGRERALAAVTSRAADVAGAGATLGRLAAGRPASFTVFDGDPFSPTTRVRSVVLDGRVAMESR